MSGEVRFSETQHLRAIWVWLLILSIAAFAWVVFLADLVFDAQLGNNPAPRPVLWCLLLVFGIGLPWFLKSFRLTVTVTDEELGFTVFPICKRKVLLADIESVEACSYRPIREYLGWGVRYMPGRGWAYTVDGNKGVRLVLRSGRKLLLGSRQPEELAAQIEAARSD